MGPDVIMASGGGTGHSDKYVSPRGSIAFRHHIVSSESQDHCHHMAFSGNLGHGHGETDHTYSKTTDRDMVFPSNSNQDFTMASGSST